MAVLARVKEPGCLQDIGDDVGEVSETHERRNPPAFPVDRRIAGAHRRSRQNSRCPTNQRMANHRHGVTSAVAGRMRVDDTGGSNDVVAPPPLATQSKIPSQVKLFCRIDAELPDEACRGTVACSSCHQQSGYGGAQRQVIELANAAPPSRMDVQVCTLSPYVPLASQLVDHKRRLHLITKKFKFDVSVIPRLAWLMRRLKIDVVQSYLFDAEIAVRLAGRAAGIALVVGSERNTDYRPKRRHLIAYRLTARCVDLIIEIRPPGQPSTADSSVIRPVCTVSSTTASTRRDLPRATQQPFVRSSASRPMSPWSASSPASRPRKTTRCSSQRHSASCRPSQPRASSWLEISSTAE